MAKTSYPLAAVLVCSEPGPVVLLTTLRNEQPNVMPCPWHTCSSSNPAHRLRGEQPELLYQSLLDGGVRHQYPAIDIADKVVGCGNCSGASENKFQRFLADAAALRSCQPAGYC